jgi:hypothetical protein
VPVRTLSVSDPRLKRKKLIVTVSLLDLFLLVGVFLFVGIFVAPELLDIFLLIIPVVTVMVLSQYVVLGSILLRSACPVVIYPSGVELPDFLLNRLLRRPSFIRREEIASIWSGTPVEVNALSKDHLTLHMRTRNGRVYDTGVRDRREVSEALE